MKHNVKIIAAILTLWGSASFAEESSLKLPEQEILSIVSSLQSSIRSLQKTPELMAETGIGTSISVSNSAYLRGLAAFSERKYKYAISQFEFYANTVQNPTTDHLTNAYRALSISSEKLGDQSMALETANKLLSILVTKRTPDYSMINDTLERIFDLIVSGELFESGDIKTLISNINTLDYPDEQFAYIKYRSAKIALIIGETALAERWLSSIENHPSAKAVKPKGTYLKSIVAMARGEYDEAKNLLSVVATDKNATSNLRSKSKLALGRIEAKLGRFKTSARYYDAALELDKDNPNIIYESINVNFRSKEYAKAQSMCEMFIKKHKDHKQFYRVNMIMRHLNAKLNTKQHEGKLTNEVALLQKASNIVNNRLNQRNKVTQNDIDQISNSTKGLIAEPIRITKAKEAFRQISEINKRTKQVDLEIRSTLNALGHNDFSATYPMLANRLKYIHSHGQNVMENGYRLLQLTQTILEEKLSRLEKQKLQGSERRREAIFGKIAKLTREKNFWLTYGKYFVLLEKLENTQSRLNQIHSISVKGSEVARKTADKLSNDISKTYELLQLFKAKQVINTSQYNEYTNSFRLYVTRIYQDWKVLKPHLVSSEFVGERELYKNLHSTWTHWQDAVSITNKSFKQFNTEVSQKVRGLLARIEKARSSNKKLKIRSLALQHMLQEELGRGSQNLLANYQNKLGTQLAKTKKWLGDKDWETYTGNLQEQAKLDEELRLKKQKLDDEISELLEGQIWQ